MTDSPTHEARLTRGLHKLAEDVPLTRAAVAPHPTPARRGHRWWLPAMTAAAVAVVVLGAMQIPRHGTDDPSPAAPAGAPAAFPDPFAAPPVHIARQAETPGGRAIALIEYGGNPQSDSHERLVLVGAGRDVYRVVPDSPGTVPLLSPDGTQLAVTGEDGIHLVQLDGGRDRVYAFPRRVSGFRDPLAFSPDGKALVVSDGTGGEESEPMETKLIDLGTGTMTTLFTEPTLAASFSPDGERIALQTFTEIRFLDRSGRTLLRYPAPVGENGTRRDELVSDDAWSPDGRWLAVVHYEPIGKAGGEQTDLRFLPTEKADSAATAPRPVPMRMGKGFLAWWSADRVLLFDELGSELWKTRPTVQIVPLNGSPTSVLATLPVRTSFSDVAGALVRGVKSRPGGKPDFGP